MQHSMALIRVEGTIPDSWEFLRPRSDAGDSDENGNEDEDEQVDGNEEEDKQVAQRGGGDIGEMAYNGDVDIDMELDANLVVGEEELLGPHGGAYNGDYNNNTGSRTDYDWDDDDSLFSNDNFEGELDDNIMVDEEEQVAQRGGGDDG